jgi:hypothetical protein
LNLPPIDGMPINEHDENRCYIIEAFPFLYPTSKVNFHEQRNIKVTPEDYFKHLMQYHDGRFVCYPYFRYFAWNSILQWLEKTKSRIFIKKNDHKGTMLVSINNLSIIISLTIGKLRDLLHEDAN